MLIERASSPEFLPQAHPDHEEQVDWSLMSDGDAMRTVVEPYFAIATEEKLPLLDLSNEDQILIHRNNSKLITTYTGFLRQEPHIAYAGLDRALAEHDRFLLLRENPRTEDAPHRLHIIDGRLQVPASGTSSMVNIFLLGLTVLSVFFAGTTMAVGELRLTDPAAAEAVSASLGAMARELWRGSPYALSIMAILIAHEMGHYLMMRYHKLSASLPYFIPAWLLSPFGTFGATIILRETPKNRRMLLDIGAAGPLAGFLVALPILLYGLHTSYIVPLDAGMVEGNSLLYAFAKMLVLGEYYPTASHDVLINQMAFAGWTGLFWTALNMIPLGQLDGGHVVYALLGERARWLFLPFILVLVAIAIFTGQASWLFFLLILFLVGRFYAVPLDAVTRLDRLRQVVAVIVLTIFVVSFTPVMFYERVMTSAPAPVDPEHMATMFSGIVALVLTIPRWWRTRCS